MSLSKLEQQIIEAIKNGLKADLLTEDSALQGMLDQVQHGADETSHTSQFRWEGIDDAFKLKLAGEAYEDSITSAFFQTHSYKYLDNPSFKLSFETELENRAVPTNSIQTALGYVDDLVKELSSNPGEQDAGWNPNIDEIVDVTTNADDRDAKYTDPFTGGGHYPENDTYDKGELEGF
jgi:hypothetical protein